MSTCAIRPRSIRRSRSSSCRARSASSRRPAASIRRRRPTPHCSARFGARQSRRSSRRCRAIRAGCSSSCCRVRTATFASVRKRSAPNCCDDEMVDTPLDRLLEIGIRRSAAQSGGVCARREANSIPTRAPARCWRELGARSSGARAAAGNLPRHLRRPDRLHRRASHHHDPIERAADRCEETPPFMRATTFASMDTPGPFENVAQEAYFNVTLPERAGTQQHIDGFMAAVQLSDDQHTCGARGLSGPLRSVPVDAPRSTTGCAS